MTNDVVFYKEYSLGHLSFMVANDMTYFTQDVMSLFKTYHPIPSNIDYFMQE